MSQPDTVQLLLAHIQEIQAAFDQANGDTRQAFDLLAARVPDLTGLPWNTFRTRVPLVKASWEAGFIHGSEKVRDLQEEVSRLREELDNAGADMGKRDGKIESDIIVPKTLAGWSINRHGRGYWRAFRKVRGKVRCVYLGMAFDLEAAGEKLAAKNREMEKSA